MEAPGNSSKLRSKQHRNKRQKNGITSPGTMRQACIHKNNTWEKKASGELEMCVRGEGVTGIPKATNRLRRKNQGEAGLKHVACVRYDRCQTWTDRNQRMTTSTMKQQLLGPASRSKYYHQCEATWTCGRVWASASKDIPLMAFFFFFVSCMKSPIKSGNQKHFKSVHFSLKILAILVSIAMLGDLATVNICSRRQVLSTPLT